MKFHLNCGPLERRPLRSEANGTFASTQPRVEEQTAFQRAVSICPSPKNILIGVGLFGTMSFCAVAAAVSMCSPVREYFCGSLPPECPAEFDLFQCDKRFPDFQGSLCSKGFDSLYTLFGLGVLGVMIPLTMWMATLDPRRRN